jgi:hypothetical protein
MGSNRYLADFADRFAGFMAAKRRCGCAMAFASGSIMASIARRSSAARRMRAARSAKVTFVFINMSFELAGNFDLLPPLRQHGEPSARSSEAVMVCPSRRAAVATVLERGEERVDRRDNRCRHPFLAK